MKDGEFQKKLEFILEKFERIDREIQKCFDREKFYVRNQDQINRSCLDYSPILDNKYKKEK